MADSKFLQVAKQAAQEAGDLILKYSQNEHEIHNKGKTNDFATQADLNSDKLITQIIKKNFPDHNIIAEESGETNNNSEYTWAIDPIDGTIAYASGVPTYGISIGLLKDNQPFLGVINLAGVKELYWAEKGKGVFLDGRKIKIRKEDRFSESIIGVELAHTNRKEKLDQYFYPIVDKVRGIFSVNSAVWQLTYLANGKIDGLALPGYIWDFAAGAIIVTEAGGKITDYKGEDIDWTKKRINVIGSNGLIHDDLVNLYKDLQ